MELEERVLFQQYGISGYTDQNKPPEPLSDDFQGICHPKEKVSLNERKMP